MWNTLLIVVSFAAGYAVAVRFHARVVDAMRERLAK